MHALLLDFRLAVRALRKRPGFTLVAVLSIALGIGFNAAVFSAANALLLRPVPGVAGADRVVEVGRTREGRGFDTFTYPDFVDLREQVAEIQPLAAYRVVPLSWGASGGGERVKGMAVSPGYFEALGARAGLGRVFGSEEEQRGGPAVAVISDAFWRDRLDADPDVVGRTIDVNRRPVTVLGVTGPGFQGHIPMFGVDIWVPIARMEYADPDFGAAAYDDRRIVWLMTLGRLAPDATVEQADAAASLVMARLAEAHPESNRNRGAAVLPLGPVPGAGRHFVRGFLLILGGLVGLVLLVAASNVAGMMLARGVAREKEIAIRAALGSGRYRVIRQLVVESLVLFGSGALGGLVLAWWMTRLLSVVPLPGPGPITLDVAPDARVALAAVALALLAGVVFGLMPALQVSRPDLVPALKDETRAGPRGTRLRRVFASVQVAFSLVLLIAAGLFGRALLRAGDVSQGFDPSGVRVAWLDISLDGYGRPDGPAFQRTLLEGLRATAGVEAAALALDLPMDLSRNEAPVWPEGWEDRGGLGSDFNAVSDGYFEALRIPVHRGRTFTPADGYDAPLVVVVNEEMVRRVWPDTDPIGKRLRWSGADSEPRTVVGVVADVKNQTLAEEARPITYLPAAQRYTSDLHVVARGPGLTGASLRAALLQSDPRLTVGQVQTLEAITGVGLLPQRVASLMGAALGGLALFLSALGVYGVVSYSVTQRRREMGIRLAVGASRGSVLGLVVGGGLRLALPGLAAGIVIALAASRLLRALLFGVSPTDPFTFVTVATVLITTVAFASWVPALRAARVDPMAALRSE